MTNEEKTIAVGAQSLAMLEQVRDYLARLPRVPATLEVIKDIDAHLSNPETAALIAEARMQFNTRASRAGRIYSPAGRLMVEVTVHPDFAVCKIPILEGGKTELPPQLSARLADGLTLRFL